MLFSVITIWGFRVVRRVFISARIVFAAVSSVDFEPAAAKVGFAMFSFTKSPVSGILEFTF